GVRSASGALPMALFRRGERDGGRAATRALPPVPSDAHDQLMTLLERRTHPAPLPEDHEVMADLTAHSRSRQGVGA
ncbi:MAG TPA: hypothetical protein VLA98_05640, partial [Solirubrobacteraceae bacterium]|nr:hypothetical protein [Solirubrobacteraceae bacterium]